MKATLLAAVAGLSAGAFVAAQVPPAASAADVRVVAQVSSQVAGTVGAMNAMGNPGGEPQFVTMVSRGPRLAISWRLGTDAMSARPGRTDIIDFSRQVTDV